MMFKITPALTILYLFTLGPLLNGVGGIYTKYLCKTRDKMVEKHITKYLQIQINI